MRLAISTDGDFVSAHFGRCPSFTIVDIEDGKITKKETIGNPGHHPGFIPKFLNERNVECIVAGGMGMRAQELFKDFGIRAVLGVTGRVDQTVEDLISGNLQGGPSLCNPRSGKGYGVDKTACDHPQEDHCGHEEEQ